MKKLFSIFMLLALLLTNVSPLLAHGYVLGTKPEELKSRVQYASNAQLGYCKNCVK